MRQYSKRKEIQYGRYETARDRNFYRTSDCRLVPTTRHSTSLQHPTYENVLPSEEDTYFKRKKKLPALCQPKMYCKPYLHSD
jgi:hypothetical protein